MKAIMNKLVYFVIIILVVSIVAGCGLKNSSTNGYQKITPHDAKAMMDEGKPYTLLDVRTQGEYDAEHIDSAILIPYDEVGKRAETELSDKNALIFVYCRSGSRSAIAAKTLVSLGYTNVYDMGGIVDWPYETIKGGNI